MTTTTTPGSQRTLTTAPVGTREGTTSSSGTSGVIAGLHAADGRRGGYPPHLRCRVSGRAQGNRADQFDLDKYVVGALSAGASGFLLKDAPPADIIAGIRVVTAGDALLAPSVTRRLLDRFATRPEITNMAPPRRAGAAHRPGARGYGAGRARLVQRRDTQRAVPQRAHRQDSRRADPHLGFRGAHVHPAVLGGGWAPVAAGLTVLAAGVALRTWAILTLGRLFKFVVVIQEGHRVVASGPYRLLRHPSYTGGLLAFLGVGIALDSWLSVLALVLFPLLAILVRIHVEEAELATALGPEYTRYASRTHRLVPGLW